MDASNKQKGSPTFRLETEDAISFRSQATTDKDNGSGLDRYEAAIKFL